VLLISVLVALALVTAVLSLAVPGGSWLLVVTAILIVAAFLTGRTKTHHRM
jgi:uncharacterized membrane protein